MKPAKIIKITVNPIIIGMNPTKGKYRKGCAWYRLQDWIDELDVGIVAFTNLSHDPYWNKKTVDFAYVRETARPHGKVIALGGLVSKVLSGLSIDHYTLPHPSPLNRQINNHAYISQRLQECKEYLHENFDNGACGFYRISHR